MSRYIYYAPSPRPSPPALRVAREKKVGAYVPSPAKRKREGPTAQRGEGEGCRLTLALGRVVAGEVAEFGDDALEMQGNGADRPVALLGDVDFGHVMHGVAAFQAVRVAGGEFLRRLVVALLGLVALVVVLLAEDEHHHIGVLLDRARFTQIGQLRALVVALFHRARELGERQHRHTEFLGDGLE